MTSKRTVLQKRYAAVKKQLNGKSAHGIVATISGASECAALGLCVKELAGSVRRNQNNFREQPAYDFLFALAQRFTLLPQRSQKSWQMYEPDHKFLIYLAISFKICYTSCVKFRKGGSENGRECTFISNSRNLRTRQISKKQCFFAAIAAPSGFPAGAFVFRRKYLKEGSNEKNTRFA